MLERVITTHIVSQSCFGTSSTLRTKCSSLTKVMITHLKVFKHVVNESYRRHKRISFLILFFPTIQSEV